MARRKLPIFTERTLAETKADQVEHERVFRSKLGPVSCKAGCSNCCSHAVYATPAEGVLTYIALTQKGHWTPSLRKRLEEHARQTWDLSPVVWHLSNIPCPLLAQNRCLIYEARPFTCRVVFADGDPDACHPHRANDFSSVLPHREAVEAFFAQQRRLLKRHGLPAFALPISKAILAGEKVATGEADMEDFTQLLVHGGAA